MALSSTALPPARYLESLADDSARLATVAARDLDRPVPHCPGWRSGDVAVHTGEVFWHKVMWMRTGARPESWPEEPSGDQGPVEFFLEAYDALLSELTSRGPSAPADTWWPPDQTVGFWYRRMAQEVAIHRIDAEIALDDVTPMFADVAVDGVDEVLRIFLPAFGTEAVPGEAKGQRVAVEVASHRWVVTLDPTGPLVANDDQGEVDATVVGGPADMDLWLWGRGVADSLTITGDLGAVDALRSWLVDATQ